MAKSILTRLRYSKKMIQPIVSLIRWHMFTLPPHAGDGAVRRLIARVGSHLIPDLLALRRADIIATGRIDYQTWLAWQEMSERIRLVLEDSAPPLPNLTVNGADLIAAFHLEPGPIVGRILDFLREIILEDPASNQKEILLNKAAHYLKEHQLFS
jgi:poly(A) polymerase/tRNA nucleotidyltransferase (CCA-adding enzyme)